MRSVGVPSLRPIAMAIAIALVGGTLLETGAIAHTSIASSRASVPQTAVVGMADPMRVPANPGSATGDGTAADVREALHALDPDSPRELALAQLAGQVPPGTSTLAAGHRTIARAQATQSPQRKRRRVRWRVSPHVTWYGPGFYGNRTACGQRYTRWIVGVAHRTLPCGTMVKFRWHGKVRKAPVIDRGPYGPRSYKFDWSARLACRVFKPRKARNGCFTRYDVRYRVVGKVNLDRYFAKRRR